MTTKSNKVLISNLMIETVKKDIKNMYLGVYPPKGRIRVAAPLKASDETIKFFVISKIPWIKKQQLKFINQERQTKREYISGESHYFLDRKYRLNVIKTDSRSRIEIKRKSHIDLYIKPDTSIREKEEIFDKFYRTNLKSLVPILLEKWQKKVGVKVKEVRIKKMKTKWGTCNPNEKRIWLNLELTKKPLHCIDYVFVHELIHLIEKNHSERFIHLLENVMPNWRIYKDELNKGILGYSMWDCDICSIYQKVPNKKELKLFSTV